jgi:hypothetical protein
VVVLLPNHPSRARLIQAVGADARITVLDVEHPIPKLEPIDVVLLHADSLNLTCSPLLDDPDLGFPELVFVVDDAWSPQHFALKSRGFRYVISQDELSEWFPTALMRLSSLAQARRIVLRAYAESPTAPELPSRGRWARGIKLHAAETRFRDVFLRSLLAEHGSRRKAAEEAGVPYRSFCEMLRKLGI